jgi:hypothetical protein
MPDSDVELAILRLAWRVDALDDWRSDVDRRVAGNERELARLVKADEIAEAVAEKMKHERVLGLTFVQKAAASLVGLVVLADGIKGLVS